MNILIVIDMQKDFINGSLGTKEAVKIVPNVIKKIKTYDKKNVFATMDTHSDDYLNTNEGKKLPIKHCIENTDGWQLQEEIKLLINQENIFKKNYFGSIELVENLKKIKNLEKIEIVGLCSDICVIVNAILLKEYIKNVQIVVDKNCIAGTTKEKNEEAISIMKSCQIDII